MNRLLRITALALVAISVLSFFWKPKPEEYLKNLGHPWEEYDPSFYNRFQNIQSIINYSDSSIGLDKKNTLTYYNFVAQIIRKRFYHGYSYYNFSNNPLSFLAGRLIWSDLSAIVIPEDIMKHPMAACSQQSIVLMEIFKRNKVKYRKVAFPHHYAVEGFIENQWRYFDTDMEPNLPLKRESVQLLRSENKFFSAYANSGYTADILQDILRTATPGTVNESPARRVTFFHKCCALLVSKWFLLVFFILSFWNTIKLVIKRRVFRMPASIAKHESGKAVKIRQLSEKKVV